MFLVLCLQLVPHRVVVRFTLLQLVYLLGVWALTTWAGIAGIAFPLPIMALVPLRQFVLPRLFDRAHLSQLDAAEYEEAPPVPNKLRAAQVGAVGALRNLLKDQHSRQGCKGSWQLSAVSLHCGHAGARQCVCRIW